MADMDFKTPAGQTISRELLVAYLNTGTSSAPVWSPVGKRVEDSSLEYDWGSETKKDIFGNTYTNGKKPTITQSFDPYELDAGDPAQEKIWNIAVKDQDANALFNQDMLIAHFYVGNESANFAERYQACAALVTRLGGEGGGSISTAWDVTYGGERTLGTVSKAADGKITFTPDAANDD